MANLDEETNPSPGDDWYRLQAKKRFQDEGFFEIDENAPVSQAEGNPDKGAYVQAWIWISDTGTPFLDQEQFEDHDQALIRDNYNA